MNDASASSPPSSTSSPSASGRARPRYADGSGASPRTAGEQAHWLRLQVYKEMFGSGLVGHPDGIIRAYVEKLAAALPQAQTKERRDAFERDVRVLGEEFHHYRLFADILENATGEPVRLEQLRGWQLPEDAKLQQLRQGIRESRGRVGEAAIGFTEGGGASFFHEGRSIGGDPIADQIAAACAIVFGDEAEHGEHGAIALERGLDTEEEWAEVASLVTAICAQRLRMRYEMFALPVDEARIAEITEGKIEPIGHVGQGPALRRTAPGPSVYDRASSAPRAGGRD